MEKEVKIRFPDKAWYSTGRGSGRTHHVCEQAVIRSESNQDTHIIIAERHHRQFMMPMLHKIMKDRGVSWISGPFGDTVRVVEGDQQNFKAWIYMFTPHELETWSRGRGPYQGSELWDHTALEVCVETAERKLAEAIRALNELHFANERSYWSFYDRVRHNINRANPHLSPEALAMIRKDQGE